MSKSASAQWLTLLPFRIFWLENASEPVVLSLDLEFVSSHGPLGVEQLGAAYGLVLSLLARGSFAVPVPGGASGSSSITSGALSGTV
jgi:hypothetical protein